MQTVERLSIRNWTKSTRVYTPLPANLWAILSFPLSLLLQVMLSRRMRTLLRSVKARAPPALAVDATKSVPRATRRAPPDANNADPKDVPIMSEKAPPAAKRKERQTVGGGNGWRRRGGVVRWGIGGVGRGRHPPVGQDSSCRTSHRGEREGRTWERGEKEEGRGREMLCVAFSVFSPLLMCLSGHKQIWDGDREQVQDENCKDITERHRTHATPADSLACGSAYSWGAE